MAIAFDAATGRQVGVGVTSKTFSHTTSGSDRFLFVSVLITTAVDRVTGVTYGGVSMTRLDAQVVGGIYYTYGYYLANPASGANDVVISTSASTNIFGGAVSYTGVHQTTPINANNKSTANSTAIALSITSTVNGCWFISNHSVDSTPNNCSAGANTTARLIGNSNDYAGECDSGGSASAGAYTLNINSSSTQNMGMIGAAITSAEPVGGAVVNVPTLLTLGVG